MSQVGNRIQHALRGYTPSEQKAIKASADSFRPNPAFDTEDVITDLGVGEALVSVLDAKSRPQVVGQTLIRPPASRLGPATDRERADIMRESPTGAQYDKMVDRRSAHEMLLEKRKAILEEQERLAKEEAAAKEKAEKEAAKKKRASGSRRKTTTRRRSSRKTKSATDHVMHEVKLVTRQILRTEGRRIIRGILGGMMRR